MIGEVFRRYEPRDINVGVLQKNYFRTTNFVSFFGSSHRLDTLKNETVVIENTKTSLWESDGISNSYFIVNFSKNILKLSHISMLSCVGGDCSYNIEVYGSNNGEQWELACKILKEKTYFKGNVNNADCKSFYSYKMYKLMQIGKGENDNYYFPIYYLELFGDLYYKVPKYFSQCYCRKNINRLFIYLIFLIC